MRHTKKPWTTTTIDNTRIGLPSKVIIHTATSTHQVDKVVATVTSEKLSDEDIANARLLTAAPRLLEQLEKVAEWLRVHRAIAPELEQEVEATIKFATKRP